MKILNADKPYIISTSTLLLQSVREESRLQTLIIEKDSTMIHPRRPLHLIRSSCQHYGTTFEVATNFARKVLNDRHKVPIVLAVDHGIPLIMIPTLSPSSEQNIWIAFHAIIDFKPGESGYTYVRLTNNYVVKLQTSEATIQRQIALAYLLQRDYQSKFVQVNQSWTHTPPRIS